MSKTEDETQLKRELVNWKKDKTNFPRRQQRDKELEIIVKEIKKHEGIK